MTGAEFDVHSIDFLTNPEPAGLGPEFTGMGVFRVSEVGTGCRATALSERDYALTACVARRDLDGFVSLAATAVRWLRIGWPEEWDDATLNPAWAPVYPAGWSDV